MHIDRRKNARAASAGSILVTRGAAGIVTDSRFRDKAGIAELSFSFYQDAPSVPTNPTLHQAIAIYEPIGCGDVSVFLWYILLGDDDRVKIIPGDISEEIADEGLQMTLYE